MTSATDKRRQDVLCAIVTDYIDSREPVGSKRLVERHGLGVSSATVRNDMAVLESEGLIEQEHASSGRIPTEKGYRSFVDTIQDVKPMSPSERRAIERFLAEGVDLQDLLRRAVQLLSHLTHQVAMVQLPNLETTLIKHCEVVSLAPERLLLVLITDTGRVDQRNVQLDRPLDEALVARLRDLINSVMVGTTTSRAVATLGTLVEGDQGELGELAEPLRRVTAVLRDTLVDESNERLILAGMGNASRMSPRLGENSPVLLDLLEEQVVMLRLLANAAQPGHVNVVIGEENDADELRSASVVTTAYGLGGGALGGLGVVGPMFMDYPNTMSKVRIVAQYVSRYLSG
ncbi:heat-inducible transcriptional repressor HrcA [Corynebacterium otitidis]|uniref:Heat-inducible transcription repressor HrcA n=1 Tax=Corynebacterium otitidis ATCC 51513 TaxID=883169 RepID=I7JVH9_9CORY|nr:heat-inducible transcriptional repressor HrcA [Corynebacterium otitidis]EJZ82632.1 heat-inducible transcription repressor HrcA [Corynebacterium otitidis ATCC 51513]CCI82866.1 Heat-inducible transcription repressor hrcA [Corynebacterium otitidis ATCC 51513]